MADHDVVVIGSGFGGTLTALSLGRAFQSRKRGETVHILERGTWWTTPVSTVQDKEVATYGFLQGHQQPVQYWSAPNHFKGFIDIFLRCVRRRRNEDGLYDFTMFGRKGLFAMAQNDGVNIVRAAGVGGGSLVYSNITIRPPNFVLEGPRWPLTWTPAERDGYFDLARDAIGLGVLNALDARDKAPVPTPAVNAGLSNIAARTARLNPNWVVKADPLNQRRGLKQINPAGPDPKNRLWLDRARIFQTAVSTLTPEFGMVDSSINDVPPEPAPYAPADKPKNYCERQGRCNVGCLPGARHTLNKQLMDAIFGTPANPVPKLNTVSIEALAEVDVITPRPEGGYTISYLSRDPREPWRTTAREMTAKKVVLAAGCVGTNEILLRSKERGALPDLSPKLGFGFSTNGDYIAFLEKTKEHLSLIRGPVTTSFAHFNTPQPGKPADTSKFHTLEDQGIPPALSSTVGFGVPLIRSLSNGRHPKLFVLWSLLLWVFHRAIHYVKAFFMNARERQEEFKSEDEYTHQMMCVVGMGRDESVGQFRLGGKGDTTLRLRRADGKPFHQDPIFDAIRASLKDLAPAMAASPADKFSNPFLSEAADALEAQSIAVSHPLGGCIMAKSIDEGVVDEFGRVFKAVPGGQPGYYDGLVVADGSVVASALGVNPSLTISALALRVADQMVRTL